MSASRTTRYAVAAAVGVALAVVRAWGLSDSFQLYGDQMRDWAIALQPFRDLPLSGTPTFAGGRTWGPAYYWTLWALRHLVGPFVHNLPHAGGVGQGLLQSAADALLFYALWRRTASLPLALGAVLLLATNPLDLGLTRTIWNPPIAVAYVKLTIATVLLAGTSVGWAVGATALAWIALQVHLSAIFLAASVMAAFVVRDFASKGWQRAAQTTRALVETAAILEIPYILDQIRNPGEPLRPTSLAQHVGSVHVIDTARLVVDILNSYLATGWNIPFLGVLVGVLIALACVVLALSRDVMLASVSVFPLFGTAAALALWQGYFESYWLLTLAPPFFVTVVVALRMPWPRVVRVAPYALLLVALVSAPYRIAEAHRITPMPAYGPLSRASLDIRRRTAEIADIRADFDVPSGTRLDFIYTVVLGGRIVPATGAYIATIHRDGDVTYTANPR